MIDRVEFIQLDQAKQMREFKGKHALRLQKDLQPSTKSFRSGTCARTLLPSNKVGGAPFRDQSPSPAWCRKTEPAWERLFDRRFGDIGRGLNAKDRHVPSRTKYCSR